jgi:hypothetical protein
VKTFEVPVVFITAYPERFLTGERPEPAFLISKPFQPAMVSAVASQPLFFQRNSRNRTPRVAQAIAQGQKKPRIDAGLFYSGLCFISASMVRDRSSNVKNATGPGGTICYAFSSYSFSSASS